MVTTTLALTGTHLSMFHKWRQNTMMTTHLSNFGSNIFFVILPSFMKLNTLHEKQKAQGWKHDQILSSATTPCSHNITDYSLFDTHHQEQVSIHSMLETWEGLSQRDLITSMMIMPEWVASRLITPLHIPVQITWQFTQHSQVYYRLSSTCSTGRISSAGTSNILTWVIQTT